MSTSTVSSDDTELLVQNWIQMWNSGALTPRIIVNFFSRWVPTQRESLNSKTICIKAVKIFEEFIFFENKNIDFLKEQVPSFFCENFIENNKFYYKCEECQAYEGRVLCVECFNNSKHKYHNYKIGVAQKIKFCNCGEEEAWKSDGQCTKHSTKGKIHLLPSDVKDRIRLVFEALVLLIGDFTTLGVEPAMNYIRNPDDRFGVILYDNKSTAPSEKLRLLQFVMNNFNEEDDPNEVQMTTYLMSFVKKQRLLFGSLSRESAEALHRRIESFGSAFTALVLPQNKIYVQSFIFKIIAWLESILQCSSYFKEAFAEAMIKPILSNEKTMLEIICHSLSVKITIEKLYRLLISSSLKEYTTKKCLAEFIVKNYGHLRTNIRNNHRPNISSRLSNLTLHLFTVPSISHHLISTQNPIYIILSEFLSRFRVNYFKFIHPEQNFPFDSSRFDESLKALNDLEYLLMAIPTIWTEELRAVFQNDMASFFQVLAAMEGMDSFKQKTGLHQEYERSWQEAVAVQRRVGDCTSLFLKWCIAYGGSLTNIYQKALQFLNHIHINREFTVVTVFNYSAGCLENNSRTVSTYFPLTRCLAGLHILCLANAEQTQFEPSVSQLISIIDPVVSIFVTKAQSHAGLWRRNGNTVEYRTHFYGNWRYRTEMLDRDIQLLQIGACQFEDNQFMIHLLEKFGLIDWVKPNFQETSFAEEIPCIAEQFLELLIHVVSERCFPELSPDGIKDQIKQEIIHALCIKPSLSHSELMEVIFVPGPYQKIDLDKIISEVAVLKRNGSGEFELKEEFFDQYNPYFYHYTAKQRSKSNNFQRQRRKAANEPDFFPPPPLLKLHPHFHSILKILQCGLMFHIMKTVLERSINLQARSYTEAQLQNVLYLIGFALQEEESCRYTFFKFTEKARKWQLKNYLEQLQSNTREDLPKDLVKWTMSKYKEVAGRADVTTPMEIDSGESEKLRRSKLVAEKRAKVLADIAAAQMKFMECNIAEEVAEEIVEMGESYTCILCQETQTLQGAGSNVFVIATFVRYSAVLCADKEDLADKMHKHILDSFRGPANYASSCGHTMHKDCFHNHVSHIRAQPSQNRGFDAEKFEFLCPLCQCLNNAVLPILPPFRARGSAELSESLRETIETFMSNSWPAELGSSIMKIWKSLTYTLYTIETLLRNSNKPLLGPSSGRYSFFLESFVRTCAVLTRFGSDDHLHGRCTEELKLILTENFTSLETFLNADMLNVLIVMTCSKTSLFETVNLQNLHLIFLAQIVKIIFYAKFGKQNIETDVHPSENNLTFQSIVGMLKIQTDLSEEFIWNYIRRASLPFLRCCALFHSSLTGIPTPPVLTELGGDTFSNLCSFLGLPQTKEDLLYNAPAEMLPIIKSWCNSSVFIRLDTLKSPYDTDPYHINQLIQLPDDYSRVIERISSTNVIKPYVCLVCGYILNDCCLIDNGNIINVLEDHKQKCGVGIFLNATKCKISLGTVSKRETYFSEAPYVDDFNETDENLQRGNPLYLSSARYKKLHTLWLSNGIEEEISRKYRE